MGDDLDNVGNKILIGCDFIVPGLYKQVENDSDQGIELDINLIGACERRKEFFQRFVVNLVRRVCLDGGWGLLAEDALDVVCCCFVEDARLLVIAFSAFAGKSNDSALLAAMPDGPPVTLSHDLSSSVSASRQRVLVYRLIASPHADGPVILAGEQVVARIALLSGDLPPMTVA